VGVQLRCALHVYSRAISGICCGAIPTTLPSLPPSLCPGLRAADETAAKDAALKTRSALPELEAAKDAAAKEREAAAAKKAALSKESAARQTTLDRLRHERHDLLARVQTSQLTLPLKSAAAAAGPVSKADKRGKAGGRRKGGAGAASDDDDDMGRGKHVFSQGVAATDGLDAAGGDDDADDRRIARIDFSKLTLETADVSVGACEGGEREHCTLQSSSCYPLRVRLSLRLLLSTPSPPSAPSLPTPFAPGLIVCRHRCLRRRSKRQRPASRPTRMHRSS
jgi:hypothetical protein